VNGWDGLQKTESRQQQRSKKSQPTSSGGRHADRRAESNRKSERINGFK
jgi:hypothetical protein